MKELFITFPLSEKCLAITTTTELGNMAFQVDNGLGVEERRRKLAKTLGINEEHFVYVHQHHSDKISIVNESDLGRGAHSFEDGIDSDALYTRIKGVPLCIFHADCVPIFFINEKANIVGIIHAGYKGTLKHVAYKAMKKVIEDEHLAIEDLKFYIGPYRMPESFEVDEQSQNEILEAGFKNAIIDHHFDNALANIFDLYKLGIKKEQISSSNLDTFTNDLFYSAYKKTPVGRMVSVIVLQ